MPQLMLYDFPADPGFPGYASFSPFVNQVVRALHLAKLPFEHKRVDILKLGKINPTGQLPVLSIDGELVADSTRILHRIEALVPGSMTGGLDARGVAESWLWEEFADTGLYGHVLCARWEDERSWQIVKRAFFGQLPPVVRDLVAGMVRRKTHQMLLGRDFLRAGKERWEARVLGVLDLLDQRAPEQGFWLGARPCAADLGLFAQLHALCLPSMPWNVQFVAKRERLARWLERVDLATRS